MKSFVVFLALVAGSLVGAAFLSYPLWQMFELFAPQPFGRVYIRAAMICGVVGFVFVLRYLNLQSPNLRGFGAPRGVVWRDVVKGVAVGAVMLAPVVVGLFALEVREFKTDIQLTIGWWAQQITIGMAAGIAVAFIEESFCRGAMQGAMSRDGGVGMAILLQAVLYASLHFLGSAKGVDPHERGYLSGFDALSEVLQHYGSVEVFIDALLALVGVGIVLGIVRARTGSIAFGIGMHASWVSIIFTTGRSSEVNTDDGQAWLTNATYDGVIGWGALLWMLLIVFIIWRWWPLRERTSTQEPAASPRLALKVAIVGSLLVGAIVTKDVMGVSQKHAATRQVQEVKATGAALE